MTLEAIKPYLGDISSMLTITQTDETKSYAQPALKNLGSAVLVVLREVISPASFRNAESEITDIDVNGRRHVRAVANKFKFGERARGLQVLRFLNAGGATAQNKTAFYKGEKPSDKYDLNTLVFGDSANTANNKVLSVKAAAQYSDAVSIQDYADVVDTTFHNRASEDGSLWDAQRNENSNNLFERHFVKPGALLLQTIAFNGKVAPMEAVEHLLLSIGLAGAYGGATSIYGVNVRNHLVGFYAGHLERDLSSPYVAIDRIRQTGTVMMDPAVVRDALQASYRAAWPVEIPGETLVSLQRDLIKRLEADEPALRETYGKTATQVGQYFDAWFEGIG